MRLHYLGNTQAPKSYLFTLRCEEIDRGSTASQLKAGVADAEVGTWAVIPAVEEDLVVVYRDARTSASLSWSILSQEAEN